VNGVAGRAARCRAVPGVISISPPRELELWSENFIASVFGVGINEVMRVGAMVV
jgi:hypothetical protein